MRLRAISKVQACKLTDPKKWFKVQGLPAQSESGTQKAGTAPVPVTQSELCVCDIDKQTKTFRGLSSSKWADPGYHHPEEFPRSAEMLKHSPACPARVAWEKKHLLESGAQLKVQVNESHLPHNFQLVCPPKPRRLNPYALPFNPFEH